MTLFFLSPPVKPCQLPDDTPNGHYQLTHGDDFVFGSTIKYFCNEGYVDPEGFMGTIAVA